MHIFLYFISNKLSLSRDCLLSYSQQLSIFLYGSKRIVSLQLLSNSFASGLDNLSNWLIQHPGFEPKRDNLTQGGPSSFVSSLNHLSL